MPAVKQAWPKSALCWSPATPPDADGMAQQVGRCVAKVGGGGQHLRQQGLGGMRSSASNSSSHWFGVR